MKFIQVHGFVSVETTLETIRRPVIGYAFQIQGFEYFHTWVTPFLGWSIVGIEVPNFAKGFVVSHWESGLCLSAIRTRAFSKGSAAELAAVMVHELGHEKIRAAIKKWSRQTL